MRTREEVLQYALSFPNVYEERPFRDQGWQLVRVKESKKTFLWIYERNGYVNLNVKVDPQWRDFWRSTYASVIAGYHQNKEHWNTIILDGSIPENEIQRMISESYDLITDSPTKRIYEAVKKIPKGHVATYGKVAELAGDAKMARAVGNVVETQLLTPEYLGEKLLSKESEEEFKSHVQSWIDSQKASEDTLYSSISNIVEEDRLNNFIASAEESLSDFLSEKIIAMEPGKLIVDKVMQEAQNKLSESMFGMMLGGSFLEKIAGQVQDGIDTYIQENAREYVGKAVVKESKELQEKPMPEVTAFLEEKGIYDPEFLWGLYKKVIEDKLPALLSSLKLSLVVEERINAMQVEEVEELVLSIMNKELGAIVNLGAVIGLILGLINVIIFII